jgi:hypothetical protein
MTDESQTPPPAQATQLTPENFAAMKQKIAITFDIAYDAFVNALKQVPVLARHSDRAMTFFDSGALWMKDGINKLEIQMFMQAAPPPAPVPPPVDEPISEPQPDAA